MDFGTLQLACAYSLLEALYRAGVRETVVSPGSRSTPLLLALEHFPAWPKHVVVDERSAGFFALGRARKLDGAVLLICTSGSAPAHYYPALIEAHYDHHPLIVLSADRAPEEHDRQSHQTIDQKELFGRNVKAFFDLGVASTNPGCFAHARKTALAACCRALSYPPGPVHINAAFRKPLEPTMLADEATLRDATSAYVFHSSKQETANVQDDAAVDQSRLHSMADQITRCARGLFVVGPQRPSASKWIDDAHLICSELGFPLLAESTSQWRYGCDGRHSPRIACFEALLGDEHFMRENRPEVIVQIGRPPISRAYQALLDHLSTTEPPIRRFVLAPFRAGDPFEGPAEIIAAPLESVFIPLLEELRQACRRGRDSADPKWLSAWLDADRKATRILENTLKDAQSLSEAQAVRTLLAASSASSTLIVGNSLPIREIDWYGTDARGPRTIICQRGAAGIDGLIAGAVGYALDATDPTILLIGDLSFAHDIGSLLLAARVEAPLLIAVVGNGGGRIFETLPAAERLAERGESGRAFFEKFFLAPRSIDLNAVARAFDLHYRRAHSADDISQALSDFPNHPGATILEIVIDTSCSSTIRRNFFTRTHAPDCER